MKSVSTETPGYEIVVCGTCTSYRTLYLVEL